MGTSRSIRRSNVPRAYETRERPSLGRSLAVLVFGLLLIALDISPVTATSRAAAASPAALHVEGNRVMNATGQPVILHGVNRQGSEYMCVQGRGIFDGPSDQASIDAIKSWRANAVRVPLNEDCWLGINGVPTEYGGATYQQAIKDYVALLGQSGLYVVLDLHWAAPGTVLANGPQPMPNADHSPAFWSDVAAAFRGNDAVILELFNEPFPDNNQDSDAAWICWRDGGSCPGVPFEAAGMQTLVNAVRGTGATNVIAFGGVQFGGTLSRWREFRPIDPQNALAVAWHTYNWTWCVTVACYESNVGVVAAEVPVIATEIGNDQCDAAWLNALMDWLDGRQIGYLAWAWHSFLAADCSSIKLVLDYAGTPSQYGEIYRSHLAGLPRQFSAFTADVRITLGPEHSDDRLNATGSLTFGAASDGSVPPAELVTLAIGDHTAQIPPGSFHQDADGRFAYRTDDVEVLLAPTGPDSFAYTIEVKYAELGGSTNPITVTFAIGDDRGTMTTQAEILSKRHGPAPHTVYAAYL
ncbi:MAG TPA: cellulase family glycosylhydrolase [Candidatus Limnocylindria bacterium]|jgi:hypothetical protein